MEIMSVRCNHCGAPLELAGETRFVSCQFCKSSLEVKRTDSSVFTEEVARIAENTDKMSSSLEVIAVQNEIEKLDREWGNPAGGKEVIGAGALAASVLFGILFTGVACVITLGFAQFSGYVALIPAGMGLFGLAIPFIHFVQASEHNSRLAKYKAKRAEFERQLEALKKA